MTPPDDGARPALRRLPTHVPGLDALLNGGLFEGGVYFVQGLPGAGKTTLASHLAFSHARNGGRVLYVTLLAESHARMLQHLSGHTFFDPALVSDRIGFISAFQQLEQGGLTGMTDAVMREAIRNRASMLVFDGLVTPTDDAAMDHSMRLFVHALQGFCILNACTALLLTSNSERAQRSERTMVDGILEVVDRPYGPTCERRIRVHKFRGCRVLRGEHSFCISDDGVAVYPQLEALEADGSGPAADGIVPSGIAGLDALLGDAGLRAGSATLLAGPTGSGKTSAALGFAGAATPASPALWVGFVENPGQLEAKARTARYDVRAIEASGALHRWHVGARDLPLDQIGHELLRRCEAAGAHRLVVDDVSRFLSTPAWSERGPAFMQALLERLSARGTTSLFTADLGGAFSGRPAPAVDDLAPLFDNVLLLRVAEQARRLERAMSIVKIRNGSFDTAVAEIALRDGRPTLVGAAVRRADGVRDD